MGGGGAGGGSGRRGGCRGERGSGGGDGWEQRGRHHGGHREGREGRERCRGSYTQGVHGDRGQAAKSLVGVTRNGVEVHELETGGHELTTRPRAIEQGRVGASGEGVRLPGDSRDHRKGMVGMGCRVQQPPLLAEEAQDQGVAGRGHQESRHVALLCELGQDGRQRDSGVLLGRRAVHGDVLTGDGQQVTAGVAVQPSGDDGAMEVAVGVPLKLLWSKGPNRVEGIVKDAQGTGSALMAAKALHEPGCDGPPAHQHVGRMHSAHAKPLGLIIHVSRGLDRRGARQPRVGVSNPRDGLGI